LKQKLYLNLLFTLSLVLFLLHPLAPAAAKLVNFSDQSENKQTQIHLHLNQCANDFSQIFVHINGEWEELTSQGNSSLYKLWDYGEYVKDDITEFKFLSQTDGEIIVPVSDLKVGVEAEGTINYWLEECPKPNQDQDQAEEETVISLDLKAFTKNDSKVYVKWNGKWKQLIRQGQSTQFQVVVKGTFSKEKITEFKCVTSTNKEIKIPIDKLKLSKEVKGSIQFLLEKSPEDSKSETQKHTQIHLHLQKCVKDFTKVYVKLNGKWKELTQQGKSPLFKQLDKGEFVKDDITEFRFVMNLGKEVILPVSELKVGVEAEGTINYWLKDCPKEEPVSGGNDGGGDNGGTDDKDGTSNSDGSNGEDGVAGSDDNNEGNVTEGTVGSDSESVPTGTLPQTGESSHTLNYLIGLMLLSIGGFLFKWRKMQGN
jgi:LPXTG-motif cell wall-anchored protein